MKAIHHKIYILSLASLAAVLALSEFLTTFFIVVLVLNHIAGTITTGIWRDKGRSFLLVMPAAAILLYIAWLPFSNDIARGLVAIRLKLPLLLLSLVIGLSPGLKTREIRIIMAFFVAGVIAASAWGVISVLLSGSPLMDRRDFSPFISHIRLALMACLAIAAGVYYTFQSSGNILRRGWLWAIASSWLVAYLFILFSLTGLIILGVISIIALGLIFSKLGRGKRIVIALTIPAIILALAAFIICQVYKYYDIKDPNGPDLSEKTLSGRAYWHDLSRMDIENGHYVWRYICEEELRGGWNRVSKMPYDGTDLLGHQVRYTLIRYLTSIGARKDSAGLSILDSRDIETIEAGYANVIYKNGLSVSDKLYQTIWQVDYWLKGGNPQGHTVTQKIEFLKNGWHLFIANPVFGTTPGDLPREIKGQYEKDGSELDHEFRLNPHNQFLTILDSFGLVGFILFWGVVLCPFFLIRGRIHPLLLMFIVIVTLSMFGEDTLETHTGITFFSLFYSILAPLRKEQL